MKKYFLLFCLSLFILSCDKDDDDPILGCTDPEAVNYNSNADTDNGTCQYDIVGDWEVSRYMWGGANILAGYQYLYQDIYANGSYNVWGLTTTGIDLDVWGTYSISGTNNSTLTFTSNDGSVSVFTITEINGSFISMEGDVAGQFAEIEADRV